MNNIKKNSSNVLSNILVNEQQTLIHSKSDSTLNKRPIRNLNTGAYSALLNTKNER